jgi:polar amino acid transport system substrate-binding protein
MTLASVRRLLPPSCLLVLAALCLGACTKKEDNRLTVGMELAYPPFEMMDEKGEPSGVSADLARALAASLHRELVIENIPFDGLIPSLKTGKIDLIISSLTATPERAESIDFSEPYLTTGLALLVRQGSDVQSVADLAQSGRTVVVKKGTTGDLYAAEHLKAATVHVLDKESNCVLEVAQGKADAFIYDQMSTLKNWQRNPDTTKPLLDPFKKEQWAIGLRKGNPLRQEVNAFLQTYRDRGGFGELGDKWLQKEKEAFAERKIPFVF